MARGKPEVRVWRPEGVDGVELQHGVGAFGDLARHWHEEHRLYAVTRGHGEAWMRGRRYPTPAGTLLFVAAGEVHSYRTPRASGCDFLSLDFEPEPDSDMMSGPLGEDLYKRFLRLHR